MPPKAMTIGKTTGSTHIAGGAELRAPHSHGDHREDMVEAGDGMLEAAGKSDRFATALVSKSR